MSQSKKIYVYVDFTKEEVQRPFYVGKGLLRRVKSLKRLNACHCNFVSSYGQERIIIYEVTCDCVQVLENNHPCMHEQDIFEMEIASIAMLKTRSHKKDGHWGANHTDGGEGSMGCTQSAETRKKRSLSLKGKQKSQETREKLSKSQKGRKFSDEHKEKLRLAVKTRPKISDLTRQKMGDANRRRTFIKRKPYKKRIKNEQ